MTAELKSLARKYQVTLGYQNGRAVIIFNPFDKRCVRKVNTFDPIEAITDVIAGPLQNPYGAAEFEKMARGLKG